MKQPCFFVIALIFSFSLFISADAQSWQWGQRGGSADGTVGSGADEYPRDIAVDPNGNVYVITRSVGATGLNIAGTPKTAFSSIDVMLASFNCRGDLRWAKIIGSTREDYGYAVQTDKNGGVYFAIDAGLFSGAGTNTLNFDVDKVLNVPNTQGGKCYKTVFLAKYDTSGNFKWVTDPQPDTVGGYSVTNTGILSIEIDDQGNVHCLSALPTGTFENSYVVSKQGTYILKYDPNGNFLGGIAPDIKITGYSIPSAAFKRDNKLNRYIISGTIEFEGPVSIGGKDIKGTMYVAAFDNAGKLLWSRTDTGGNAGISNRVALDDSNNIYIAATTVKGGEFNGYITKADKNHGTVMVMKMDKNGNMIWAQNAVTNGATESAGVALRNSGEVVLLGSYPGLLRFNTMGYVDSLNLPANSGYHPFIARFNTQTGKLLGLNSLASGGNVLSYDILSDNRSNIFISGQMGSAVTVNGKKLSSAGGYKDFFVAKYGYADCNCTNIPEPKFTQAVANHFNYTFSYTGSAATTYEWDFGDGSTSTQINPTHTYTTVGDFIACVKVTNSCGDNIYCTKISTQWPQSVTGIENNNIKIYPNPANNELHVDGVAPGSRIELYDIVGRKVHEILSARENEIVNISYLSSGNYIIQLTDRSGNRVTGKVVKQ